MQDQKISRHRRMHIVCAPSILLSKYNDMKADWKQVQFYRFHYIMLTFTLSSREPYLLYSFKMTLIVVGNKASLFCEFVCVFDYRWFCFVSTNPRCQNKHLITGKQCIYLSTNAFDVIRIPWIYGEIYYLEGKMPGYLKLNVII